MHKEEIDEEQDMRNRIHRLEDVLLRNKDFKEQLRLHNVLNFYRKKLQKIIEKKENSHIFPSL